MLGAKTGTCIEKLVKQHLIGPVAKIVDDYTKKYKFKGKSIEKLDLPYTVCCDENKKYAHTTNGPTVLLDVSAVDNEIFILNNCFNISVYDHISKQMTREFELDLPCDIFHHYSAVRKNKIFPDVQETVRIWEFSNNGTKKEIKKVKMFISNLNNEILLYFSNCSIIFVFNSLNGNFIRKIKMCCRNNYDDVAFDGEHLYAIGCREGDSCDDYGYGIIHVSIINILDGSLIRKWNYENRDFLSRIIKCVIDKNTMCFVATDYEYFDIEIYACNAADGKNMRNLKNNNLVYGLMVYDDYVYTYDCGRDDIFNVFDIANENNEQLFSVLANENNEQLFSVPIVSGLIDYKVVLHYGKLFLIKENVCLKGRTWLEKNTDFNKMLKSNTLHTNDEVANSNGSNDEYANSNGSNDDAVDNDNNDNNDNNEEDANDIVLNDESESCLDIDIDIDGNNRIKISLYVIY